MQNWFEVKTKFIKVDDDGREKKSSEIYLVDAVTCTEAEERAIKELSQYVRGDINIGKVVTSNIVDIFPYEVGEYWWKCKIATVVIDETAGKEKRVNNYFLVAADNAKQAIERLEEGLSYLLVPYEIRSVVLSNIVDVFAHFGLESVRIDSLPMFDESESKCIIYDDPTT